MKIKKLQKSIIGRNEIMHGPYGKRFITYADYTASGRTVQFIENYLHNIQKTYANTHTQDNCTGQITTSHYKNAKEKILSCLGASKDYVVIPCGNGATGAICRLLKIIGVYEAPETKKLKYCLKQKVMRENGFTIYINKVKDIDQKIKDYRPVVFISSYEHHSNELTWRESFCEVVKVGMTKEGYFDLNHLEELLKSQKYQNRKRIGSFSAASNVTGVKTPIYKIAQLMHKYNGLVFFDYAASAPYVDIKLNRDQESYLDGIYLSPHKFIGGPGSSGLLIIKKDVYNANEAPTCAGGGTVEYVGNQTHYFYKKIETREDAGTPGILQTIKASLAIELKNEIGISKIHNIEESFTKRSIARLSKNPNFELLGPEDYNKKISILSFNIKHKQAYFHHKYIARLLNDLFGIQTRAGCACAGPYGHYLLNIDDATSSKYQELIANGLNIMKPGWVRLNFHYTINEQTFNFIIKALEFVADNAEFFISDYIVSEKTGTWCHKHQKTYQPDIHIDKCDYKSKQRNSILVYRKYSYAKYLKKAHKLMSKRRSKKNKLELYKNHKYPEISWFYITPNNINHITS